MKFILFDRVRKAGDNAEYFYRWIAKKHPEITIKYILTSDSYDWPRLTKDKFNLIDAKNKELVQKEINTASYICSSYLPVHTLKGINITQNFIFLNHGCFYRKLEYLKNAKFDLMLAGNKFEYDTLLDLYKFPASKIALTGQPRQDSLILNNKNYTGQRNNILIQFWWRPWLNKDTFEKSDFYKNVSQFLMDNRLKTLSEKYNVNFLFKLHCEMEKYLNLFKKFTNVTLIPPAELFEPLFIKSSLLITDMTSNVYEMGIINKPCLYFEPDWKSLTKELIDKGETCLDIKEKGLGPITFDLNELFIELEKILANNYQLDQKYIQRRKEQITFLQNPNCCERAFKAITRLPLKQQAKKAAEKKADGRPNTYLYF